MNKALAALILALAALIVGCGGDDDSDTSTSPKANQNAETTKSGSKTAKEKQGNDGKSKSSTGKGSKGSTGASSAQVKKIKDTGGAKTPPGSPPAEPKEFKAPKGGDDSIQTYGTVAEGEEQEAVIAAMRSFFTAMAGADYPAICGGLTEANRKALEQFLKAKKEQGDCTTVLRKLQIERVSAEARKAANGSVFEVRIEDENAFVLFTPEGGKPSYFVMKREGDDWKSTGLSTGTPFNPIS